jgi:hypothetical protein
MKKIYLLLTITIIAINIAHAQNEWVSYKIDNKLSVKVPSEPMITDEYSVMAQSKDSLFCVISVIDLKKIAGIDSAALASLATTSSFSNHIKTGMLGKMQGFTLGDFKISKWKGYYCYNVDGSNAAKKQKINTFMVIVGTNIYSLSAMMYEGKSTKGKEDFFNSLALN